MEDLSVKRGWCKMENLTQMSLFDGNKNFSFKKPIRLIEFFA